MEELEPWPEDDDEEVHDRRRWPSLPKSKKLSAPASSLPRSPSPDAWQDKASNSSPFGSPPRTRSKPLFAGPPPPIAASTIMRKGSSSDSSSTSGRGNRGQQSRPRQSGLGSLLFDYNYKSQPRYQPDSAWRGLRRREKALEAEIQQLLDLQATGLVAGREDMPPASEVDGYSDTGSSTPTGTFYSTATSKSRMANSLYVPTKSTAEGNVIPVRQPNPTRPRGLRSARTGLRRSISALAQLKAEEDSLVEDALAERKKALNQLSKLHMRRDSVSTELKSLEEDEEEPLGQEIRTLGAKYEDINKEIRDLEEKLVGLRNQRRRLRGRMEDVQSRRDAGLSGYRGALKDVNSEVDSLMHRPPVQPLDLEALQQGTLGKSPPSAGGLEFLKLIPERRTLEMAKSWWESEVSILEQRKSQVEDDRLALEEGGALWSEVVQLVCDYESRLRGLMKGNLPEASAKGKEKVLSQEDVIRDQIPEMERVAEELEKHQHFAEDKGWNLLICAIGAELEAFGEAQEMLKAILAGGVDEDRIKEGGQVTNHTTQPTDVDREGGHDESSDNEVPPDLLVSQYEDQNSQPPSVASPTIGPELKRTESSSENEVPQEFLVEHRDKLE